MAEERTRTRTRSLPEQVEDLAEKEVEIEPPYTDKDLLSTGSTLLNLACSNSPNGGFRLGRMVNLIGDSSSGKTLQCLSLLAEAAQDSRFDDYQLILDDAEAAQGFNIAYLFGQSLANRIESPLKDEDGKPLGSDTIQQFQYHVTRLLDSKTPFIYVLDSFDALSSDEEIKRMDDAMDSYDKGKEVKGTYAMEKAKVSGRALAMIVRKLWKSQSIVIIISQTRDNIDPMSFSKKTRSGGKALKFYATHEIWMAVAGKKKSKDRVIGVDSKIKISKNKLTGKIRECEFPIYYDYGIDDIGSCVDFLVKEGHWKKQALTINAEELGLSATRDKLIRAIEDNRYERKLKRIVGKVWNDIEDSIKLNRKARYA